MIWNNNFTDAKNLPELSMFSLHAMKSLKLLPIINLLWKNKVLILK